ncbi:hypothetical protein ACFV30_00485 [Streptomyces sp. NPDC059752]|uniref:hypothetical protein n=1 Tax=Streptomyces sp. NPDC059752 TaxID=3346932 RepID=UPI003668A0C7
MRGGGGTADGLDWRGGSNLLAVDRPEVVLAAFRRGEPNVGVAVIGLALHHADPEAVLPVVARALESADREVRRQGVIALAHVARLHRTVDRRCPNCSAAAPAATRPTTTCGPSCRTGSCRSGCGGTTCGSGWWSGCAGRSPE